MAYVVSQAGEPIHLMTGDDGDTISHTESDMANCSGNFLTQNQVSNYQVIRLVGRGGMGEVYEALDRKLNRRVAIKVLNINKLSTETLTRIDREAAIQSRLNHPNIVTIYEFRKHENPPLIVMELVDGKPLDQVLQGKPISPQKAATVVAKLARAINYAHKMGVLHRDLKPSNILITGELPDDDHDSQTNSSTPETWSLKVIDFGLSKWLVSDVTNGLTSITNIVGTPAYIAPELTRSGSQQVGPSPDIHALGVILYECLIGRPPFVAENALQTLDLIRNREPVAPVVLMPLLQRDLNTICLKCLEKDPAKRYTTALELAEELERFLGGFPIKARPLGLMAVGLRWCGRNRSLAKALTASVILLGMLIFGSIYFGFHQAKLRKAAEQSDSEKQEALNVVLRQSELASNYAYFWVRLLNQIQRDEQGRPMSVQDFLAIAERDLNKDLLQTPEGKTSYLIVIANAYERLGEKTKSEATIRTVEEILSTVLRIDIAPSYEIREALTKSYLLRNQPDKAIDLIKSVLASRQKIERLFRPEGVKGLEQLADLCMQQKRATEAIPFLEKTLAMQQSSKDQTDLDLNGIHDRLKRLYQALGHNQQAGTPGPMNEK